VIIVPVNDNSNLVQKNKLVDSRADVYDIK